MPKVITSLLLVGGMALAVSACSSDSSSGGSSGSSGAGGSAGSGSGGTGGGSGSCDFTDLCSKVTFEVANQTCGMSATASSPIDAPGSSPGSHSSICRLQDGSDDVGGLERHCFGNASDANLFYTATHDAALSSLETQTDLTGVGDKAFYREAPSIDQAKVYVLQGNLIAVAADNATGGANKQDCLVTLAEAILAAQ
jgi:hypothetical protein